MSTLLTFNNLVEQPDTINIFGTEYELLSPKRLGLERSAQLNATAERIQSLFESGNLSQVNQARKELNNFIKKIMPTVTEEALNSLSLYTDKNGVVQTDLELGDNCKLDIMQVFIEAVEASKPKKATPQPKTNQDQEQGQAEE